MRKYYAKPGTSQCFNGNTVPNGYTKMKGPSPYPEAVAQADGTWKVPDRDNSVSPKIIKITTIKE